MVNKCYFKNELLKQSYEISFEPADKSVKIKLNKKVLTKLPFIEFYMEFDKPIISWRNHDYCWIDTSSERIANDHSPKIVVLKDHTHVLSTKNTGLWHYEATKENVIKWVLKHPLLTPVFQYDHEGNRSFLNDFEIEDYELTLLFTKNKVPEFSRSKIPFSAIMCFTDHCDFDTNGLLIKQLKFFKDNNIRITKGFFLNSFSKRKGNASFLEDREIIARFREEGHELVYHALTQSIRKTEDAIKEFNDFEPPLEGIDTWIDHGYQPYNFTKQKEEGMTEWAKKMTLKKVRNLWTYIDSGTASRNIINQINPNHFTPKMALNAKVLLKETLTFFFRTFLFYSGNEKHLMLYRSISSQAKEILRNKKLSRILPLILNLAKVTIPTIAAMTNPRLRNRPFKYAQYSPLVFRHKIGDYMFNMFQTIEITDFEDALCPGNIELLIKEKGILISHNYFSSDAEHQKGRLIKDGLISETNKKNFKYLGTKIKNEDIWNPTISELIEHIDKIATLKYEFSQNSDDIIHNHVDISIRHINYE